MAHERGRVGPEPTPPTTCSERAGAPTRARAQVRRRARAERRPSRSGASGGGGEEEASPSSANEQCQGRRRPEPTNEKGAGLFGTIAGVTVFLAFLTVAVQILMNLYTASVVTSAAYDAARLVATDGEGAPLDDAAKARAEDHARELLGGLGDGTEFTWIESDPDVVQLRVVARSPRFLLPVVDGALGLDVVDRTVTVRLEQLQP